MHLAPVALAASVHLAAALPVFAEQRQPILPDPKLTPGDVLVINALS